MSTQTICDNCKKVARARFVVEDKDTHIAYDACSAACAAAIAEIEELVAITVDQRLEEAWDALPEGDSLPDDISTAIIEGVNDELRNQALLDA